MYGYCEYIDTLTAELRRSTSQQILSFRRFARYLTLPSYSELRSEGVIRTFLDVGFTGNLPVYYTPRHLTFDKSFRGGVGDATIEPAENSALGLLYTLPPVR